jgi:hypothetical protein
VSFTKYHPTNVINIHPLIYSYRLWSDCTKQYVRLETSFVHDDMTKYNWNYMDQYIARDPDCKTLIDVSFQKFCFLLHPCSCSYPTNSVIFFPSLFISGECVLLCFLFKNQRVKGRLQVVTLKKRTVKYSSSICKDFSDFLKPSIEFEGLLSPKFR